MNERIRDIETDIKNPIIIKANSYIKKYGLGAYDTEFFNITDNLSYLYDVNFNILPSHLLNKNIDKEYYINNSNITNKNFLSEKEAIEIAKNLIKEIEEEFEI